MIDISGTPCPTAGARSNHNHRLSLVSDSSQDGDTTNIDYTRLIVQEFKNAKPKRPKRLEKRVGVTIFENVIEGQELAVEEKDGLQGKKMLLGKPARRVPPAADTVNTNPCQRDQNATCAENYSSRRAQQNSRRRTIFVPSDGTTIMTIHPGASTTSQLDDTFNIHGVSADRSMSHHSIQLGEETAHIDAAWQPRSALRTAPRRAPLSSRKDTSNNLPAIDRFGNDTGKENVPPHHHKSPLKDLQSLPALPTTTKALTGLSIRSSCSLSRSSPQSSHPYGDSRRASRFSRKSEALPYAATLAASPFTSKKTTIDSLFSPLQHPLPASRQRLSSNTSTSIITPRTTQRKSGTIPVLSSPRSTASQHLHGPGTECHTSRRTAVSTNNVVRFGILEQDVLEPSLYEDNWLDAQEAALSYLLNRILEKADHTTTADMEVTRTRLMTIYHSQASLVVHGCVRAAIQSGGLTLPSAAITRSDPTRDIGVRRRFLGFWLDTFDLRLLMVAAEVVVGRSIARSLGSGSSMHSLSAAERVLDAKQDRRALISFLETFFVRVDDIILETPTDDDRASSLRHEKRVLRSLMLLWLLDQIKQTGTTRLLFRRQSIYKSTSSALQSVATVLLSSIGDSRRVLGHSGYVLTYIQQPLDEITYRSRNIAIDLRDGVILARLVDIIKHSISGTTPTSQRSQETSALLRFPCHARAQKTFNIKLSLDTLRSHAALSSLLPPTITPDDILDGHRQTSITLLWSLLENAITTSLIDWDYLRKDLAATRRSVYKKKTLLIKEADEHRQQLVDWAAAHCWARGRHITNYTTSFADGEAYLAIIRSCIAQVSATKTTTTASREALKDHMRGIGCDITLIKQFIQPHVAISTRITTLANLACLAAALLPLKQRFNAAVTIQSAWRRRATQQPATHARSWKLEITL